MVLALVAQVATLQESVDRLTSENAALKAENISLKDEIARLKGLPPRPKFKVKPSGMSDRFVSTWGARIANERAWQTPTVCHLETARSAYDNPPPESRSSNSGISVD